MADKKISELPAAESLESTDLMMVAQENVSSSSGYVSMKITAADVADEFNTELTYNDLNTTDKTIVGSINEVKGIAEGMVEANPAGSASTALDKIKIGNTKYDIQELDVSNLTGNYYLIVNAHGWNAIISNLRYE